MEKQTQKKTFKQKVDDFFSVSKKNSKISTEIIAGVVTFLAMAYILTLNPSLITNDWGIGGYGKLWSSVFLATALGAVVGTLLMAFVAKMPLAQAPGLGLDSMVGAIIGAGLGFTCSFGNAMFIVLVSGIVFILLSVVKIKGVSVREKIFDGIPLCVRGSISVGIGLFIAFIGMQNSKIIVDYNTLVTLQTFSSWNIDVANAVVCLVGLIVIVILEYFHVKGSVILGIIAATLLGIPLKVTSYSGLSWKFWENFAAFFSFETPVMTTGGTFFSVFTEGFSWAPDATVMPIVMTIITFSMVDMFDTMGTAVGCATAAGLCDEDGKPDNYEGIMIADSVATCAGALLGTSTVTTFVESGSGVAAGGKTGLTALSTAICFFFAIFLMPIIGSIPSAAASSALLYVGCLMLKGIKYLKFENIKHLVPAFLTIAMMPLSYSITNGIGFGIVSYVVIEAISYVICLITGKKNKYGVTHCNISLVTWIIFVLFVIYFFVPTK